MNKHPNFMTTSYCLKLTSILLRPYGGSTFFTINKHCVPKNVLIKSQFLYL